MKIAASSNNRCVDRAFSVLRCVLGYDTPLPDGWDDNTENRDANNMIGRSALAFPDNEVLVWCQESIWESEHRPPEITYRGEWLDACDKWDKYLFAFVYGKRDERVVGHMVTGWPVAYGDMQISFVVAVKVTGQAGG